MTTVADHLGEQLAELERKRASSEQAHLRFAGALSRLAVDIQAATDHYIRFGVATVLGTLADRWKAHAKDNPRGYFRALAKQLDRPYAFVDEETFGVYAGGGYQRIQIFELLVTRSDRLSNVTGGLLLAAVPVDNKDAAVRDPHPSPLYRADSKTCWHFLFRGDEGEKLLDQWLTSCRTDLVFRITLKATG
jgi:hypothetical protein